MYFVTVGFTKIRLFRGREQRSSHRVSYKNRTDTLLVIATAPIHRAFYKSLKSITNILILGVEGGFRFEVETEVGLLYSYPRPGIIVFITFLLLLSYLLPIPYLCT